MAISESPIVTDADYLRLIIHGTTAFELLRTGLELDLFEHLETSGGMSVSQVASVLEVGFQPARVLLLGLASLRLLEKQEDRYHNTALVRRKLLRSGPRYLGPLVEMQARVINPSMVDFAESLSRHTNVGLRRISGPGHTLYERLTAHPELQEVFYANMRQASRLSLAQIRDRFDFTQIQHLIDLAGGDGMNSVELARRYPHLAVTVFDQESVVRLGAQRVTEPDLRRRLQFHAGDIFADPLPGGADAILYFHIFEIWSLERNIELLRKCWAALPAGGRCLVYNFVSDDAGTGSMTAGLLSPYFLTLASGEGMVYSAADMEHAVAEAGFSHVERYDDLGFNHTLVVGHR